MGSHPFLLWFCPLGALIGVLSAPSGTSPATQSIQLRTDDPATPNDKSLRVRDGKELRILAIDDLTQGVQRMHPPPIHDPNRNGDARTSLLNLIGTTDLFAYSDDADRIEADQIIDLIRTLVHSRSWDQEGSFMEIRDERLVVANDSKVLDDVELFLRALRQTARPWFEVRCVAWNGDGRKISDTLTKPMTADLLREIATGASGQVILDSRTRCRANDPIRFSLLSQANYQPDLDCEVANDASIRDPKVRDFVTGTDVWLRIGVDPLQQGFVLSGIGVDRSLEDLDTKSLSPVNATVELATLRQANSTFEVVCRGREGFHTRIGGLDVLFVVERMDPVAEPRSNVRLVPTRMLSTGALRHLAIYSENDDVAAPTIVLGREEADFEGIIDVLNSISRIDEDDNGYLSLTNGMLVMRASEDKLDLMTRFLTSWLGPVTKSFAIELRREVDDGNGAYRTIGEPLRATSLAGKIAIACDGRVQDYVRDYNVEIAEKSSISDPIISSYFTGMQIASSVREYGDECLVDLFVLSRELSNTRHAGAPAEGLGAIDFPTTSDVSFSRTLRVRRGDDFVLGEGPKLRVGGRETRTRLVLKVREL
ncbi:MAG: hypothetical protein KDC95_13725 [Planctomycetes bacterium]|nr:hypothetical protein [Planctomycetota bacterium]